MTQVKQRKRNEILTKITKVPCQDIKKYREEVNLRIME
jgi:DNA-binding transcriptional regulator YiaG